MASFQKYKNKKGKFHYKAVIRKAGFPTQCETFKRLTDARRWAAKTETEMLDGKYFRTAKAKKRTFDDMVKRYIAEVMPDKPKSVKKQTAQLNWWNDRLGKYHLLNITPSIIAKTKKELAEGITPRGTKRSPATVVRYMAALSHVYTIAINDWEWLHDNPMQKISRPKEPPGRVRWLKKDEIKRLSQVSKESTNKHLHTIIVLALSTGMRKGEILNLTWDHVDFDRQRIILRDEDTKNKSYRNVPLKGYALDLMKKLSENKRLDSILIFAGKNPNTPMEIRKPWVTALKDAGVKCFRFHDARHTSCTHLAMNGATLAELAEFSGHKTLAMVKRYIHIAESHISEKVEDMNALMFGGM